MIENDEQLEQAREALGHLERALRALRERIEPSNPSLFRVMAESYMGSISRIRADMDTYLGIDQQAQENAPLWMVLEGEAVSRREISSKLLSEWLERFRKAVYGVTVFLEKGIVRISGRPDATLFDATDPRVLAVAPGSIRVGLRLPTIDYQEDLFSHAQPPEIPFPQQALERLLEIAKWANSGEVNPPIDDPAHTDEVTVVARYAATLAPTPRSVVRRVTFTGALVPSREPLRLDAEARARLHGLVQILSRVSEETVRGQIREIDLDAQRVILRERGPDKPDLKCILPAELMSRAEKLLDRSVVVYGIISSASPDTVQVISIEPDEIV